MEKFATVSDHLYAIARAYIKDDMKRAAEIEAALIAFHMTKVEAARQEGFEAGKQDEADRVAAYLV